MKSENLFNAIGLVSDEKIAEADSYVGRAKEKRRKFSYAYSSLAAMCAVFLVIAGVSVYVYNSRSPLDEDDPPTIPGAPFIIGNTAENNQIEDVPPSILTAPVNIGNTAANIQNGGRAAYYDGWIYYINNIGNLCRKKEDGSETAILNERNLDSWTYINVINDLVFYADFCYDTLTSTLYKSSLDGTNETVVLSFTDRTISNVTVADDWIYYRSIYRGINTNEIRDDFIHRIRLDGTEHTQLSHVRSLDMMLDDGWIYYIGYIDWVDDMYLGINYIYKMRLDGSESSRFNDGLDNFDVYNPDFLQINQNRITSFLVNHGWIYYVTGDYDVMYKIRTDFTDKTLILPEPENVILQTVNISGEWLYYYDNIPVSIEGVLKRINNDGEIQTVLSVVSRIYIIGGWIYYYVFGEYETALYRVGLDGTGLEEIGVREN
jgi:hypothetical protein